MHEFDNLYVIKLKNDKIAVIREFDGLPLRQTDIHDKSWPFSFYDISVYCSFRLFS